MKQNLKIINYLQTILWIITIIGLLIIIVIPKIITTVESLFPIFIVLYMVMPIILLISKAAISYYYKYREDNLFAVVPFGGVALLMPMVLFYFVASLNNQGKLMILLITGAIFIYHILAIILTLKHQGNLKLYLLLLCISIILYITNIYLSITISYNYSVNW